MRKTSLTTILKEGIADSSYIWKEELKSVFHDRGVEIFFFFVPLFYPVLYSLIYNTEVVRDVHLAVVDQSKTFYSREYIRRVDAAQEISVVANSSDLVEAKKLMDSKKVYGILVIPSEFSKDLHQSNQTHVAFYSDMGSMLNYKAILMGLNNVSLQCGKDVQISNHPLSTDKLNQINVSPISYEAIDFYNPQLGFATFLVPAILILVIHQTLVLGICMLGGTAREKNRYNCLVPLNRHFNGTLRIVFGKGLAYLMIYMVFCLWVFIVVPKIFSFPQLGKPSTIMIFILPFLFACIFFSMTLSGFIVTRESPMMVFVSVILLFMSGVTWPMSSIPHGWRLIACLFPSTGGIQGFIRINTMGALLADVAFEYKMLWVQAGIYFITACLVYRYQIIHCRKVLLRAYKQTKQVQE